jgi:molecular chaperone DnaK (HSP70)
VRLGIDFGTTRTVVAYADRGNYPVVQFVDRAGDTIGWIPSIVAERDGELRYGLDAAAVVDDPSFTVVRSFKRVLSGARATPGDTVAVGGSVVRIDDLVAGFLSHVRQALLERSNLRRKLKADAELCAVVGVPANAFAAQRLVTIDGFRRAGFSVTAMLNEPSAAGFEYTHGHRSTLTSQRDLVVVYDLGGGTFDASVVRMSGRQHEVLATAGVSRLGGDDFDVILAEMGLRAAGLSPGDLPPRAADEWLAQCRGAKEALTPSSRKITLDLEAVLGKRAPQPEVIVAALAFYEECTPLVVRSIDAMAPLMTRADNEAATDLSEVAGIYVVGGASELPIVGRTLRERFGRRVHRSPYPSAAVAIGLAIAAAEHSDFQLIDRYTRTFAVFREADEGREVVLDPIFTRDTVTRDDLQTAGAGPLAQHTRTYRAAHNVGHFRFFECSAVDERGKPRGDMALCGDVLFPFDARLSAEKDLASIPVERSPDEGPRIVERYSVDGSGIVEVVIRNADGGYERTYRLGSEASVSPEVRPLQEQQGGRRRTAPMTR